MELEARCSAIIQKSLPHKTKDPGSFTIPILIGALPVGKALLDLGASINLMSLSMLKRIGDLEVKPTRMTLLGRPFMKTARVIIDVDNGQLKVRVEDDEVKFDVLEAMKHPKEKQSAFRVDVMEETFLVGKQEMYSASPLEKALVKSLRSCMTWRKSKLKNV